VSRGDPCPLCEATDGCSVGDDDLLLCRRRKGLQAGFVCLGPAKGDPQWVLYRREDDPLLNGEHEAAADWQAKAEALAGNLTPALRDELAGALGLPVAVLDELPLLGYDPRSRQKDDQGQSVPSPCWCFAETDAGGRAVGILRRFRDGKKRSQRGGKRGLILPRDWQEGDGAIFLPEGPSDVLALRALGLAAVARPSNTGGVGLLAELLRDVPADRQVIVLGERDHKPEGTWPGRDGALMTARGLAEKLGRPVQWALPPEGAKDVRAWVLSYQPEPTWDAEWSELRGIWLDVLEPHEAEPANGKGPGDEGPTVEVGVDEHRVSDEAEVILAANARNLYQRGRQLVQVLQYAPDPDADRDSRQRVRRADGAPVVRTIPSAILRDELSRHVRFVRRDKEGGLEPASVPGYAVATIHARGVWRGFSSLEGIVSHPVLLRDGTILATPGYDARSGLLLWLPNGLEISVPEAPTLLDALMAKRALLDLVSDFPFKGAAHESAWLASLLTPLARYAFEGASPLNLLDGNVAGVGKGLLADVSFLIVTGRRASVMGYTNNKEELRKAITTLALEGDEMVLLDNVTGAFGSDVFDRALTATFWKDRILGGNNQYDGPLNATWYATANNAYIVGDTARRVLPIRLVSPEEHPEERTGFKYPDLRKHVLDNRGRLLSAALTVLRAYCRAGCPAQNLKSWGSFEGWTDLVRAAVVWLQMPDPADTREDLRQSGCPEEVALTALYAGIEALDPRGQGLTVAALVENAGRHMGDPAVKAFLDALPILCPNADRPGTLPSPKSLGMKLHHLCDRVVDGRVLERLSDARSGARWRVVRCGTSGTSSPQSQCGTNDTSGTSSSHSEMNSTYQPPA
jgi:hypothetical protein